MSELLRKVEDYVREEYSREIWSDFDYHNLYHTVTVADQAAKLAKDSHLPESESEILLIAAWFHDLGYEMGVEGHEEVGAGFASEFLKKESASDDTIVGVRNLILATTIGYDNFDTLSKKIIRDADLSNTGLKGFIKRSRALRSEWRNKREIIFDDNEWEELQIKFLTELDYLSPAAQKRYKAKRKKNLKKYKKKIRKQKSLLRKD